MQLRKWIFASVIYTIFVIIPTATMAADGSDSSSAATQGAWQKLSVAQIKPIAADLFFSTGSPVVGNPNGDVTVVEFFDNQCEHCKETAPEVAALLSKDPSFRLVLKELPIHDESEISAEAALAAKNQGKYWDLHEKFLGSNDDLTYDTTMTLAKAVGLDTNKLATDMQNPNVLQEINSVKNLAAQLQLLGTPSFVIAKVSSDGNGKITVRNPVLIMGATDAKTLSAAIAQARQ